jgi:hypothetical protein
VQADMLDTEQAFTGGRRGRDIELECGFAVRGESYRGGEDCRALQMGWPEYLSE